jgi:hypothetical protein
VSQFYLSTDRTTFYLLSVIIVRNNYLKKNCITQTKVVPCQDAPSYFMNFGPNNFDKVWNLFKMTQDANDLVARNNEKTKRVKVLVLAYRRIRVSMIADEVAILEATVLNILHEGLGMNKVSVGFRNYLIPNKNYICEDNLGALADDENYNTW